MKSFEFLGKPDGKKEGEIDEKGRQLQHAVISEEDVILEREREKEKEQDNKRKREREHCYVVSPVATHSHKADTFEARGKTKEVFHEMTRITNRGKQDWKREHSRK